MRVHVPRSAAAPLTDSPFYARTGVRLYVRPTVQMTVQTLGALLSGPAQNANPSVATVSEAEN